MFQLIPLKRSEYNKLEKFGRCTCIINLCQKKGDPDNYFSDSFITVISRALATAVATDIFVFASAIFVSKIGNEIGAAYHYLT